MKHDISSSLMDEDNLSAQIDHSLINALSASREKFPTSKIYHILSLIKEKY